VGGLAMITIPKIAEEFSRWIDAVASTAVATFDRFSTQDTVKLIEDDNGELLMQTDKQDSIIGTTPQRIRIVDGQFDQTAPEIIASAFPGSRIELFLQSQRFLFRPIELPSRAAEFLDGIVRTQIDRLTPWRATDAAFGWSRSNESNTDQMTVVVAATSQANIQPYVQAIAGTGAHSICVYASRSNNGSDTTPIKIWEEKAQSVLDIGRVRHGLVVVLLSVGIAAGVAIGASVTVGTNLGRQQSYLASQIANARKAASSTAASALDLKSGDRRSLSQRKHDTPSTVIVLEALSQLLPNHTYVTELRIEGDKLRLVGITRDAPSLIGLIEQSGRFTQATFFAPTTRTASEQGERFHIEAGILPMTLLRS
jgi:general secretion pathway protein L